MDDFYPPSQLPDLIEQLQGIVAQIFEADKEIDDCGEREDEDKKAEERIDDGAAQGSKKEDEGELIPGKVAQLVIKVTNPSTTGTVITPKKMEELKASETEKEEEKPVVSAINPLRQPSIVKCEDQSAGLVTADVKLSTSQVYLPPKDEAAEFDDHGVDLAGHVDDKDLVVWRKNNKVGLRLEVTANKAGEQIIGFGFQYQYTNTVFALGQNIQS